MRPHFVHSPHDGKEAMAPDLVGVSTKAVAAVISVGAALSLCSSDGGADAANAVAAVAAFAFAGDDGDAAAVGGGSASATVVSHTVLACGSVLCFLPGDGVAALGATDDADVPEVSVAVRFEPTGDM